MSKSRKALWYISGILLQNIVDCQITCLQKCNSPKFTLVPCTNGCPIIGSDKLLVQRLTTDTDRQTDRHTDGQRQNASIEKPSHSSKNVIMSNDSVLSENVRIRF